MELLDLPLDLLILLTQFLYNIEDYINASSSCRTLRIAFAKASPNTILRLAAAYSRVFFRPDPHFLIALTAHQLSDWALLRPENASTLRRAFQGGIDALFELCVSKAGITMDDIRRLHASRFTLINPVSDMIDRCAGKQWNSTPDFWNGGVSNPNTVNVDADRSLFQIVIYGELFGSSLRAAIEPSLNLPRLDLDTRLDFIKYCIPDSICWLGYKGSPEVLPLGPYASGDRKIITYLEPDQVGLNHLLNCRTWRESWETVQRQIGPDFDEEWQQEMWHSAVQMQGLEGLEMLRPGPGVEEKWRPRLEEIRGKIEALRPDSRPLVHTFGTRKHPASDSPCLADEVYVCMAGLWGPWERSNIYDLNDDSSDDETEDFRVDL